MPRWLGTVHVESEISLDKFIDDAPDFFSILRKIVYEQTRGSRGLDPSEFDKYVITTQCAVYQSANRSPAVAGVFNDSRLMSFNRRYHTQHRALILHEVFPTEERLQEYIGREGQRRYLKLFRGWFMECKENDRRGQKHLYSHPSYQ